MSLRGMLIASDQIVPLVLVRAAQTDRGAARGHYRQRPRVSDAGHQHGLRF